MTNKAVIVFSGGQDSTTCLLQALPLYDEVHCITFDYGQRHRAEIDVARGLSKTVMYLFNSARMPYAGKILKNAKLTFIKIWINIMSKMTLVSITP